MKIFAEVNRIRDYYPYGMQMPGRNGTISGGEYRYAFNGMETDKEVSGQGNSYTTQFRQYDPRLGRWKSLDPLAGKFPGMSPFVAFNDNPLYFTDPLGLEGDGPGDGKDGSSEDKAQDVSTVGKGKETLETKTANGDFSDHYFKTKGARYKATYNKETGTWEMHQKRNGKYVSLGEKGTYKPKSRPPGKSSSSSPTKNTNKSAGNTQKTSNPSNTGANNGNASNNSGGKSSSINGNYHLYPEIGISQKQSATTYHFVEGVGLSRYGITYSARINNYQSTFTGLKYDPHLHVSMYGWSSVQRSRISNDYEWVVRVSVYSDGKLFDQKNVVIPKHYHGSLVPPNSSDIGEAYLKLPTSGNNVKIVLEYGYTFFVDGGVGTAASEIEGLIPFVDIVPIEPVVIDPEKEFIKKIVIKE